MGGRLHTLNFVVGFFSGLSPQQQRLFRAIMQSQLRGMNEVLRQCCEEHQIADLCDVDVQIEFLDDAVTAQEEAETYDEVYTGILAGTDQVPTGQINMPVYITSQPVGASNSSIAFSSLGGISLLTEAPAGGSTVHSYAASPFTLAHEVGHQVGYEGSLPPFSILGINLSSPLQSAQWYPSQLGDIVTSIAHTLNNVENFIEENLGLPLSFDHYFDVDLYHTLEPGNLMTPSVSGQDKRVDRCYCERLLRSFRPVE